MGGGRGCEWEAGEGVSGRWKGCEWETRGCEWEVGEGVSGRWRGWEMTHQDNDTHCFLLLRTILYRFFRGRTLAGTDSHVFLPMITALRLLWSRVSVVFLAKNFKSCLCGVCVVVRVW